MVLGPGGRYPREGRPHHPQPGDDPRVPREQTFIMRISKFLGAPLQAGIERAQRRHVGRISGIGDRLAGASVSGHHKLHRSYGSDQAHDGEFGKAVGILHLRILIRKQSDFIERNTCSIVHRIRYQATIWRACSSVVTVCVVNNRQCTRSTPSGGSISWTSTTQSETVSGWPLSEEFAGRFRLTGP